MEVHHHAHTDRKKWTHYFWEFLMLFSDLLIRNYFQLYYNGVSIVSRQALVRVNSNAINLIRTLESEYHLK